MGAVAGEKSVEDLSFSMGRDTLVARGKALAVGGDLGAALDHFGAAIRQARRARIWDLEAMYCRFVAQCMAGHHPEAVKRCIWCLDALHEIRSKHPDAALPYEAVKERLERFLLSAMARRGDGFFALKAHLRSKAAGEFYLLKERRPLLESWSLAWSASKDRAVPRFEDLDSELAAFTKFVLSERLKASDPGQLVSAPPEERREAMRKAYSKEPSSLPEWVEEYLSNGFDLLNTRRTKRLADYFSSVESSEAFERLHAFLLPLKDADRGVFLEALSRNGRFSRKTSSESGAMEELRAWLRDYGKQRW